MVFVFGRRNTWSFAMLMASRCVLLSLSLLLRHSAERAAGRQDIKERWVTEEAVTAFAKFLYMVACAAFGATYFLDADWTHFCYMTAAICFVVGVLAKLSYKATHRGTE